MKYLVHLAEKKESLYTNPDIIFALIAADAKEADRIARKKARKEGFRYYLLFVMIGESKVPVHQGEVL